MFSSKKCTCDVLWRHCKLFFRVIFICFTFVVFKCFMIMKLERVVQCCTMVNLKCFQKCCSYLNKTGKSIILITFFENVLLLKLYIPKMLKICKIAGWEELAKFKRGR